MVEPDVPIRLFCSGSREAFAKRSRVPLPNKNGLGSSRSTSDRAVSNPGDPLNIDDPPFAKRHVQRVRPEIRKRFRVDGLRDDHVAFAGGIEHNPPTKTRTDE